MHLEAKAECGKEEKENRKTLMEMTSPVTSAEDLEKGIQDGVLKRLKEGSGRGECGFDQCVPLLNDRREGKRKGEEGRKKKVGKGGASLTLLLADEEGDSRVPALRS